MSALSGASWMACLVLVWLTAPASAWGPLGHRAVGSVADALLSPGARAQVARLLADDRDRDGNPSGRTTLAEVSLWADEIRGSPADRPAWHYDNVPVCGAVPAEAAWCPQHQCASRRIGPLLAQLADRDAPPQQRREALKWIAHLVGDLHQPLHAADFAQGGNQIPVELEGWPRPSPTSLHTAWDVWLVTSALHTRQNEQPSEAVLRPLIARARALPAREREAPPDQWLAESNGLARQVAFDYPGFSCPRASGSAVATALLSAAYQRRARRVITSQLALAGARLAALLERALEPE
jgi:hypothetical protein